MNEQDSIGHSKDDMPLTVISIRLFKQNEVTHFCIFLGNKFVIAQSNCYNACNAFIWKKTIIKRDNSFLAMK